jgi:hypothetical protein
MSNLFWSMQIIVRETFYKPTIGTAIVYVIFLKFLNHQSWINNTSYNIWLH